MDHLAAEAVGIRKGRGVEDALAADRRMRVTCGVSRAPAILHETGHLARGIGPPGQVDLLGTVPNRVSWCHQAGGEGVAVRVGPDRVPPLRTRRRPRPA